MRQNRSLNVGLVFDDSLDRPDGVAQYVKTLGSWLSAQGHEVSYLVGETKLGDWSGAPVYSLSKNIKVNFNGNKLSIPRPGGGQRIKQFMQARDFDVLHVMVPYSPFMAGKVIKYASPKTAVVGTFHIFPSGWASVFGSKFLYALLRPSLKCFGQIVSVSQPAAEFAKSAYRIDARVIPNPVPIKTYSRQTADRQNNQIVFLGRLVKRKGASQLVDAFNMLVKTHPDSRLTIAGDGQQRQELEQKVKKMGLQDKINFLGYIDEKNKPAVLGSATIACFPSLYGEAFGIVLIEAMAAGAQTVIAGDNPGYRSVLGAKPELLVDPKNNKELASRLAEFLDDTARRESIHKWQDSHVKKYDIEIVGGQLIDMYNAAIARFDKNRHNNVHES